MATPPTAALEPAAGTPGAPAPLAASPRLDFCPASVCLASLSARAGRAGMRSNLRTVAELAGFDGPLDLFPWAALRFQHVAALRTRLAESGAVPATCNAKLAAVRGVLRAAWRLGQIDTDAYMRARGVAAVRVSRLPAGRALDAGEIRALFEACADGTAGGLRDAAVLALCYGAGLRRAEAVDVDVGDVAFDDGTVTVRVVGKGGKERLAHGARGAAAALTDWLEARGPEPGPLLCRVDRLGRVSPSEGMTPGRCGCAWPGVAGRRASSPAARTTSAARSSAACSTAGPTSPACSGWPATRAARAAAGLLHVSYEPR